MAATKLLADALKLPAKERGRIVRALIRSLDADVVEDPAEVERAWATEIERRAARALSGKSTSRELRVVCDELEAKRRKR